MLSYHEGEANLCVGKLGRPFGVNGWIHFSPLCHNVEHCIRAARWLVCQGVETQWVPIEVEGLKVSASVVKLKEFQTREEAKQIVLGTLWAPKSSMPPLGPDELYSCDLLGFEVISQTGEKLGRLVDFIEGPAYDWAVVEDPDRKGKTQWIPFVEDKFILNIAFDEKKMIVDTSLLP